MLVRRTRRRRTFDSCPSQVDQSGYILTSYRNSRCSEVRFYVIFSKKNVISYLEEISEPRTVSVFLPAIDLRGRVVQAKGEPSEGCDCTISKLSHLNLRGAGRLGWECLVKIGKPQSQ